ncbi:MAG: hypothetical protein EBT50_09195, partial [Verrucomicrobia bacterium]|nr:hypothetical protein [Verrucomicrobiota bacterium]
GFFSFDSGNLKPGAGTAEQNVTFTPLDPDSYNPVTLKVSVTVAKKALTVRANDQTRLYGLANPALTVTYTGLVAGETAITPAPTVTTSAGLNSLPGTYPITVTGSAQGNYEVTFVSGTLTVRDGDQDGDGAGDLAELAAGTDPTNPADRPMVISAGWNHTLFVPVAGQTALAWGVNTDGRCGLGHTNSPVTSGVNIKGTNGADLTGVIAVAAGGGHSLVLQNTGTARKLYAAGTNRNGQLGLPLLAGAISFTEVTSNLPTDIKAVADTACYWGPMAKFTASGITAPVRWGWGSPPCRFAPTPSSPSSAASPRSPPGQSIRWHWTPPATSTPGAEATPANWATRPSLGPIVPA